MRRGKLGFNLNGHVLLLSVRTALLAVISIVQAICAFGAHTQARLILDAATARPGDTVMAGIQLTMEPGWHTYWRNPGQEGGYATAVKWEPTSGVTPGEIQWPLPEKAKIKGEAVGNQPATETINYVYSDGVILLVPLKLSNDIKPGNLTLKADVSWLECASKCIPGEATVQAQLAIGPVGQPSSDRILISQWMEKLPKTNPVNISSSWAGPATASSRSLLIEWSPPNPVKGADFYPYASDSFEVDPNTKARTSQGRRVLLEATVKKSVTEWPKQIAGVLVQETSGKREGYEVALHPEARAPVTAQTSSSAESSLWLILVYAFVGGMILNVMPCVLPVIALKILGFVNESRNEAGRVRKLGLMYALGVILSFEVFAGIIIGLKAAGKQAGWGLQFGNPQFLVILTVLVTLVSLNLFGLFEVTAGGLMNAAGGAATSRHGVSGAFLNGVLATVLATPCTAPFMSVALGFAFAQPASLIVLVFFTIGAGLAFPYVLLSWNPQWLKFLPKPGVWMENFKIIMGFPMLATAVWLFSLTTVHYGERSWWLGIFLVIVGLAAWMYGRFVQRGASRRGLAMASIVGLLLIGYLEVVEGQLHWRMRETTPTDSVALAREPEGIAWQPWSSEALAAARNQGRPVVVDFTARWCVTCRTIVKPAFEDPTVREKIEKLNAVPFLADYTKLPDELTQELKRFGRAGVPMVLVYPTNQNKPAMVLPDPSPLLPPSHYRKYILEALDKVAD